MTHPWPPHTGYRPGYPPFPYGPPPPSPATVDVIATALLGLGALSAGMIALFYSMLFPMGLTSCHRTGCHDWMVLLAYGITWCGVAVGAFLVIHEVRDAARHRRPMWVYPAVAILVIVGSLACGAILVTAAVP